MKSRNPALPTFIASPGELGTAVRAARTSMGLSIEQAAAAADVDPRTQMEIETGAGDVYLGDALRVASLCGLELLVQPRGTNALAKILAADAPAEEPEAAAAPAVEPAKS